jgi:hypothetical protein
VTFRRIVGTVACVAVIVAAVYLALSGCAQRHRPKPERAEPVEAETPWCVTMEFDTEEWGRQVMTACVQEHYVCDAGRNRMLKLLDGPLGWLVRVRAVGDCTRDGIE